MVDLVETSRWVIIAGYYLIAVFGILGFRRSTLTTSKMAAVAAIIIGSLWGTFYFVLSFISPLDMEELRWATYFSRVNHLPVMAALGIMLYVHRRTEHALRSVKEEVAHSGVS